MTNAWIARRTEAFDSSGIRRVFNLAREMVSPIDLSIGQPDYDVPAEVRTACINAIESGKNKYALSQGMPVLRDKLQARIDQQYGHADRRVFVSSGTSGGLVLAMMSMVDPGDQVIVFDPYFVMYPSLTSLMGGTPVYIPTYPDFQIPIDQVASAITSRTKLIVLNSPANPTGVTVTASDIQALAELADKHNIALVSDEIYSRFCYDAPFASPAQFNERTIVIDGFSKDYAMTGWRLGFVHGPHEVIEAMVKLQQFTFVCAPQPVQWAGAVAMDIDMSAQFRRYHQKRDWVMQNLSAAYDTVQPSGAFYLFPKTPWGTGSEFAAKAIEHNLLVIPGNVFSQRDTHFRICYAVNDDVLHRGIDVLNSLADLP